MKHICKRILTASLAALMLSGSGAALLTQLPTAAVSAAEMEYAPEDDFQIAENSDGTVTITKCLGYDDNVVIPPTIKGKKVTAIGNNAFSFCGGIQSIVVPEGVTSIGMWGFGGLSKMKQITLPESLVSIEQDAFYNCTSLESIVIPNHVVKIGKNAFSNCTGLTGITIPASVTEIGEGPFSGCTGLETIVVDEENPAYDSRYQCNAVITKNGNVLVTGCKNTEIPYNITHIHQYAFYGLTTLTEMTIPSRVEELRFSAFERTGLKRIDIPSKTTKIGHNAFLNCSDLTDIYYAGSEADWKAITIGDGNDILSSEQVTLHFGVESKAVTDDMLTLSPGSFTYDGTAKTPDVTVKEGETVLKKDVEYSLSYGENINAGTGTVTVKGKGVYKGTVTKSFPISGKALSACTVGDIGNYAFTGSKITPDVIVLDGGTVLQKDTDYTVSYSSNVNAGKASVTITGKGNYTGSVQRSFIITKDPELISAGTVTLSATSLTYTGSALKPAVTVKSGDKTLKNGTDYTVSYSGNTGAGKATVTVTGKGDYAGKLTKNFTIKARSLSAGKVTIPASVYLYTGSARTPAVTVKDGSKTLKKGTDYSVSYSNNTKVGTATITVKGCGNYTGALKKTFLVKYGLSKGSFSLSAASFSYSGTARKPTVTVKCGGRILKNDTDYTVSYQNNVNVGTATAVITGKGNYTGTVKKSYRILPAKPAAPAVKNAAKGLQVSWKKTKGAGGYVIYRSKSTGSFTKVKTVSSGSTVSWNDTGASLNGSKYRYRIAAVKTVGGKTYQSGSSSAKTVYKLSRPTLTLGNISGGIKLTVGKNSKATGYQFCISTRSDFKTKLQKPFEKTTLRLNVSNEIGNKCYLKVRSVKKVSGINYYSEWSAVKSITVKK